MSTISLLTFVCVALLAASIAEAQFTSVQVNGTLYCSSNGNTTSGTSTPVFPNATVEVRCPAGLILNLPTNTTTDASGVYRVVHLLLRNATIGAITSNCRLFVLTPISTCNPALPSVGLVSNLRLVRSGFVGAISYVHYVVAAGFTLQP